MQYEFQDGNLVLRLLILASSYLSNYEFLLIMLTLQELLEDQLVSLNNEGFSLILMEFYRPHEPLPFKLFREHNLFLSLLV